MFALTLALLLVIGLLRNLRKRAFLSSFLKIAHWLLAWHHQHVDLRVEKDVQHVNVKRESAVVVHVEAIPCKLCQLCEHLLIHRVYLLDVYLMEADGLIASELFEQPVHVPVVCFVGAEPPP